jgi:hypothetical protein
MAKVSVGKVYKFVPVGLDIWDSRAKVPAGTFVKVINLPGCPPANTNGHCYIATLDGKFAGLVLTGSLVKV